MCCSSCRSYVVLVNNGSFSCVAAAKLKRRILTVLVITSTATAASAGCQRRERIVVIHLSSIYSELSPVRGYSRDHNDVSSSGHCRQIQNSWAALEELY